MPKSGISRPIFIAVLVIAVFLIPVFLDSAYWLHLIIQMSLMSIMATGLYLIFTTGQVSFAHAGFAGIGAYTSAMLALNWGVSSWIALPAAAIMPGLFALLIGWITLRIKGAYFFLATFAFGQIVVLIISNYLTDVFGGVSGLTRIPAPNAITLPGLSSIQFAGKVPFYYLALVLMLITVAVMYRLDKSRIGKILRAIQAGDSLAECWH